MSFLCGCCSSGFVKPYRRKARRSPLNKKEKIGIISAQINLSVVYNNLGRHDEAAQGLEEALSLAREMNDPVQMRSCYGLLSETYEKAGDLDKSLQYFNLYRTFHEMIQREEVADLKEVIKEEQVQKELAERKNKINHSFFLHKLVSDSRPSSICIPEINNCYNISYLHTFNIHK